MTDNRTTELREKLTERGVEYTTRDGMKATSIKHITHWYADGVDAEFTEQIKGCTRLTASGLTPQQAIAATLGSEREKELEELVRDVWAAYSAKAESSFHPAWEVDSELARRMAAFGFKEVD